MLSFEVASSRPGQEGPRGLARRDYGSELDLQLKTLSLIDGQYVCVGGELDIETVPRLLSGLAEFFRREAAVRGGGPPQLVLDLNDVTFLDVSALHALDEVRVRAERCGWRFSIVPPVARGPSRLLMLAAERSWLVLRIAPRMTDRQINGLAGE